MRSLRGWISGLLLNGMTAALATAVVTIGLAAQERPAPRVTFGFAAAPPGKQITVPILLEGAAGLKIGRVVSEVRFPAAALKFIRLERAALLDESRFESGAQLREPDGEATPAADAKSTAPAAASRLLAVHISGKSEDATLRDGIVGYLVFEVLPTVKADKTPDVRLTHETRLFAADAADANAPPLAIASGETKLVVEKPGVPVISCFFYMH